jgi:hypothetical protein
MTDDELKAREATLTALREQMPLGHNDSETALDIGVDLLAAVRRLRRDITAYLGALGHPIPGSHDGRLSDGSVPENTLSRSVVKLRAEPAEAEVRRLRAISDDALRQVFVAGWDARRRHSGSSTNPLVDAWEDYRATVIRTMK